MSDYIQEAEALRVGVEREFDVYFNRITGINVIEFSLFSFVDEDVPVMIGVGLLDVLKMFCAQPKCSDIYDYEGFLDYEQWIAQFVSPLLALEACDGVKKGSANCQKANSINIIGGPYPDVDWAQRDKKRKKSLEALTVQQLQVLANVLEWSYRQAVRLKIAFMPPWSDLPEAIRIMRDLKLEDPSK